MFAMDLFQAPQRASEQGPRDDERLSPGEADEALEGIYSSLLYSSFFL
jgi:hypothetical protein